MTGAFAGERVDASPAEMAAHDRGERPGVLGPSRWTDIYKPTIAAVNGVAYAGGLEWACWTDMAIADEHATFGVTCRRWNIGLADGGTQRLTRPPGPSRRHRPRLVEVLVKPGAFVSWAPNRRRGLQVRLFGVNPAWTPAG